MINSASRVEVPDSCPDFKGRATSRFRPKLHSRAESLSLESLNMSRAVGRESLEYPKFGHQSLDMCLSRPNFGMSRLLRPISRLSRPNFGKSRLSRPTARLMSRLARLKLSARLCNLGLNPDAARPLARLMSRLSRPYVQTLQTQTLGVTMQFGSKSVCGAILGATHVQNFQFLCPDYQRDSSFESGCGVTMADTARLSRPRQSTREFPYQSGDGATFQTKSETARLSRPRRWRRDFPDHGGIGANFQTGEHDATFQTKAETPRTMNNSSLDTERFY